jgi:hypothetical protein
MRLGIIVCVMAGGVTYSRRFYEETMSDPAIASPLLFPETVFNAPASHLAAYLGSTAVSYTLVGDEGAFGQALALATDWLLNQEAEGVVVVGAEEMDWIVADAMRLFVRDSIHSDGAGAVYLRSAHASRPVAELALVTDPMPFTCRRQRAKAAKAIRAQMPALRPQELLCLGTQRLSPADAEELEAWLDWTGPRITPKETLGDALAASSAWQCVLACDKVQREKFTAANVSIIGTNQQAIGVRFIRSEL